MYNYANGTKFDDRCVENMVRRVAWLRALHQWFHGAHHVVRGCSYAGDHAVLYDKLYTEIQDEVDGAVEKVIGLTGDEMTGCPQVLAAKALKIMSAYPSPARLSPDEIAQTGLRMEQDYLNFVTKMFHEMERRGVLPLGFNDQLAASANTHEGYVYLLQQRAQSHH